MKNKLVCCAVLCVFAASSIAMDKAYDGDASSDSDSCEIEKTAQMIYVPHSATPAPDRSFKEHTADDVFVRSKTEAAHMSLLSYNAELFDAIEKGECKRFLKCVRDIASYCDDKERTDIHLKTLRDDQHRALLHVAAQYDRVNITKALLKFGHDINVTTPQGATPLIFAARHESNDVFPMLIAHSADVHVRDHLGRSAIHWAAKWPSVDGVQQLLEAGADANCAGGHYNATPLHIAAHHGNVEIVKKLIKAGASCYAVTTKGDTPFDIAHKRLVRSHPSMLISYQTLVTNWRKIMDMMLDSTKIVQS